MNKQSLEIVNLSKSFGSRKILSDVALSITTGEVLGIFGRNGSGKTTLLKAVLGILKTNPFVLRINQSPISPENIIPERIIGFLPQDSFLPKDLSVRTLIPLYFPQGDTQDKIFYAPGVASMERTKVGKLSLGQIRYLEFLIISNLNHPFLILDEPFSMIEPLYKDRIKEQLAEIRQTKGIILTDHYYYDVLEVTTRNLLLQQGNLIEIKGKTDLIQHGYTPG